MSDGILARFAHRVAMGVVRAAIKHVADDGGVQILQVKLNSLETRDNTPRVAEHGFTSNPPLDSDVIVLFAGGDRSSGVAIGSVHQASRPRNLAAGESMMYSQIGQQIYMSVAGIVVDAKGLPVTVKNAPVVTIVATEKIIADTPLFECTGDIVDNSATNAQSMASMRAAHNNHEHEVREVQGGEDTVISEPPTVLE